MDLYIRVLKNLIKELEERFNYKNDISDNYGLIQMCTICFPIKDAIIIASYIAQIDIDINDVMKVYNVDSAYVSNILAKKIPILRVAMISIIDYIKNSDVLSKKNKILLGPTIIDLEDLVYRLEYVFEESRNIKKIKREITDEDLVNRYKHDVKLLYLLNYLSLKESVNYLNICFGKNINNTSIDNYQKVYEDKINYIRESLIERIEFLKDHSEGISCFEYEFYISEYNRLLETMNRSFFKKCLDGIKLLKRINN